MIGKLTRRAWLKGLAASTLALPLVASTRAAVGPCKRVIFFYYPDGVVGPSQDGQPSQWHATGNGSQIHLSPLLEPLAPFVDRTVFFRNLTMGPTDSGSHPGGAKKLLTATDHGQGESIDQYLARTAGAAAPYRHVYLGVQANDAGASGDKHISYPSPGQSITPEDNPLAAFSLMFGDVPNGGDGEISEPDPVEVSVIDGALAEMERFQARMGTAEKAKLDLHLEALREVEKRIKDGGVVLGPSCESPALDLAAGPLYEPARFPELLRAQLDLAVLTSACGLSDVVVVQASHHTSELLMSRFEGTPMYDPGFDMRSHQASHYGASHDPGKKEYQAFYAQRLWWMEQLAYLLDALESRPEGDGSMLDHSLVVACTEVCDGNTHLHDDLPVLLCGGGGGAIATGRILDCGGRRHADLWIALAHAMGEPLAAFGDASDGPLPGLLA